MSSIGGSPFPTPVPVAMGGTGMVAGGPVTAFTTVAGLPAANAGNKGQFFVVTDALLPAIGAIIIGGGAVNVLCFSNGTNWIGA
jgi:hypothetical protein